MNKVRELLWRSETIDFFGAIV